MCTQDLPLRIKYLLTLVEKLDSEYIENNWEKLFELLDERLKVHENYIKPIIRTNKLEIFSYKEKFRRKTLFFQREMENFQNCEINAKLIRKFVETEEIKICICRSFAEKSLENSEEIPTKSIGKKIIITKLNDCKHGDSLSKEFSGDVSVKNSARFNNFNNFNNNSELNGDPNDHLHCFNVEKYVTILLFINNYIEICNKVLRNVRDPRLFQE